ncbi:MAG: FHA domain-containing protein [Saprospiraceae bacterium]|nr:FHA domain-containing protein [Saprospiraceae bacterium]
MATINCSNPQCGVSIEIIPGLFSVICPSCGQWVEIPGVNQSSGPPEISNYPPPGNPPPFSEPNFGPPPTSSGPSAPAPAWSPYSFQEPAPASSLTPNEPEENIQQLRANPAGCLHMPDGRVIKLNVGKHVIGRQGADILLTDPSVSRKHCVIEVSPDPIQPSSFTYFIWDIGHESGVPSTNGVYISQRSLRLQDHERLPLQDGTIITLGAARILFQITPE